MPVRERWRSKAAVAANAGWLRDTPQQVLEDFAA